MAVEFKPKQNNNQDQQSNMGQPTQVAQGVTSSSPGVVNQAPGIQAPTNSGQFTNIQNYLSANTQANLGGKLAGKVGDIANTTRSGIDKERSDFETKTQQAFQPYYGGKEFINQAVYNPVTTLTDNPDTTINEGDTNLNRFKTISTGAYGGPMQINNKEALQQDVQGLANVANLGQTEAGRQSLLGSFFSRPSYTQGQKTLDNLLLQGSPDQTAKLNALRSLSAQTGRYLSNVDQGASIEGMAKKNEAAALGKLAGTTLNTETGTRNTELDKALAQAQQEEAARQAHWDKVKADVAAGNISKADAERLGLSIDPTLVNLNGAGLAGLGRNFDANQIYTGNEDLNNFLKVNAASELNRNTIASQDLGSRLNALSRLAGQNQALDPTKFNTFTGSSQSLDQGFFTPLAAQRAQLQDLGGQLTGMENRSGDISNLGNKLTSDIMAARTNQPMAQDQLANDLQAYKQYLTNYAPGTQVSALNNINNLITPPQGYTGPEMDQQAIQRLLVQNALDQYQRNWGTAKDAMAGQVNSLAGRLKVTE